MCSLVCSSTVIGCTYDIPTGIYNIYVYDIEEEGTLSDDWAISSTNITITGLEPICPSIKVIILLSRSVSMVTGKVTIYATAQIRLISSQLCVYNYNSEQSEAVIRVH